MVAPGPRSLTAVCDVFNYRIKQGHSQPASCPSTGSFHVLHWPRIGCILILYCYEQGIDSFGSMRMGKATLA
ncbi:hypothetical protein IMY05_006G0165900 [Salix suchowensis]|nr:hypothetical protein IMY05_006G0165900 [Salix suchowensis]